MTENTDPLVVATSVAPPVASLAMAQRLAGAIRFPTISHQDPGQLDHDAFAGLHRYLEQTFPRVHAALTREPVNTHSLLYTWPGADPTLPAVLLMGHLDVVPVEAEAEPAWTQPPFEGLIVDGYLWGRGSLDDKASVVGLLEAVESLLAAGFQPRRTLYLAFGHDEEIGGLQGAAQIAALLHSRGVRIDYLLDEGLAVTDGIVPYATRPVAMVGLAEKGYLSLELAVETEGGHSSMPAQETAIGLLAAALVRLERHPMPTRADGPAAFMLAGLAAEMPAVPRLVLSHPRLFGPLIRRLLAASPAMAASLRTTAAATILQAGLKENILPTRARAVVNLRLLPGDTIATATDHVRRAVADPRVQVTETGVMRSEPSPVSDAASPGFRAIEQAIARAFPGVAVVPGLVLGGTDCRHYTPLTANAYRFSPITVRREDLGRVHGIDERIAVDGYARGVAFYADLIRSSLNDRP